MKTEEQKPENPSAFPEPFVNDPHLSISHTKGMTLRDYFANSAMQGHIASYYGAGIHSGMDDKEALAKLYYDVADAMLKQREL